MVMLNKYLRQSPTYRLFLHFLRVCADFLDTIGNIAQIGFHVLKCIFKGEISIKNCFISVIDLA